MYRLTVWSFFSINRTVRIRIHFNYKMEDVHGNRITRISPCIWQMIKIFNQHFRKVIGVHVLI